MRFPPRAVRSSLHGSAPPYRKVRSGPNLTPKYVQLAGNLYARNLACNFACSLARTPAYKSAAVGA
jgi:hypothetical protein